MGIGFGLGLELVEFVRYGHGNYALCRHVPFFHSDFAQAFLKSAF